jgi:hypothetical protein
VEFVLLQNARVYREIALGFTRLNANRTNTHLADNHGNTDYEYVTFSEKNLKDWPLRSVSLIEIVASTPKKTNNNPKECFKDPCSPKHIYVLNTHLFIES